MTALILRLPCDKIYLIIIYNRFISHKICYMLLFYHGLELL